MADNFETPKITTTVTLPRDPRLLVRDHNTILRETLREAAFEHHRRHIPWHFESFAPAKYGYARRGKKYQAKKDREGLPPLVSPYSRQQGRLPTFMAIKTDFTVSATSKRATLKMRLPFGGGTGRAMDEEARARLGKAPATYKQHINSQTVLRTISELEVIASDEQDYLNEFIAGEYARRVNQPGQKFRVRNRA